MLVHWVHIGNVFGMTLLYYSLGIIYSLPIGCLWQLMLAHWVHIGNVFGMTLLHCSKEHQQQQPDRQG